MSICSKKSKWKWVKMQQDWKLEIFKKLPLCDISKYDFKQHKEWTCRDYEQSPLCQIIWGEIMCNYLREKNSNKYTYNINRHILTISSCDGCDKYKFLFDVMNNPRFKNMNYQYHVIGNFSPIPKDWELENNRSLQFKHRDLQEDWVRFLDYLKQNWNFRNKSNISFEQYIEMTMQYDYYVNNKFVKVKKEDDIIGLISRRGLLIKNKILEIIEVQKSKMIN